MPVNRLFPTADSSSTQVEATVVALATLAAAPVVVLVAPIQFAAWHQQLLQLAYEQARKALEPPRHMRLLSVWN